MISTTMIKFKSCPTMRTMDIDLLFKFDMNAILLPLNPADGKRHHIQLYCYESQSMTRIDGTENYSVVTRMWWMMSFVSSLLIFSSTSVVMVVAAWKCVCRRRLLANLQDPAALSCLLKWTTKPFSLSSAAERLDMSHWDSRNR